MNLHGLVDLSNADYHAGPGISKSKLDAINAKVGGSPLNYWDQFINPDAEPREYKHAFSVGDGTHKIVLEPGTFEETYAVDFDKSLFPDALDSAAELKKACADAGLPISGTKPELADRLVNEEGMDPSRIMIKLEEAHRKTMVGRIPISPIEYKSMLGGLKRIQADPIAAGLLHNAKVEQSFFVTDQHGVLRKCRVDAVSPGGIIIPDLKTTEDVSEEGFGRTIVKRRYHVQAAWYLDILRMLYGKDAPQTFAFIAVQKKRPYDVAVHYLTNDQIKLGRQIYQQDLQLLLTCMEADYWPGVSNGEPIEAKLPDYAMRELDYTYGDDF